MTRHGSAPRKRTGRRSTHNYAQRACHSRGCDLGANRVDPEHLRRLDELCGARYQPGDRESAEAFLRANTEFHVTVARASGNALLAEVIRNLLDREERLNHLSHMLNDRNADAYHERHELVDALIAGDGARAEQVMAAGIASARDFVMRALLSSPRIQTVNVTGPLSARDS